MVEPDDADERSFVCSKARKKNDFSRYYFLTHDETIFREFSRLSVDQLNYVHPTDKDVAVDSSNRHPCPCVRRRAGQIVQTIVEFYDRFHEFPVFGDSAKCLRRVSLKIDERASGCASTTPRPTRRRNRTEVNNPYDGRGPNENRERRRRRRRRS